jgi:glycosyltransferase involved in cell wall biosynthesis
MENEDKRIEAPHPKAPQAADPSAAGPPLSVVVPAFNEENGIQPVLRELDETLKKAAIPYEILVVDDGSRDATAEKVGALGLRVVTHDTNRGYGAALKTGFREAKYRDVAMIDADGTYPTEALHEMLAQRRDNDMVVGARTGDRVHIPLIRRPAKWMLARLANYLSQSKIPDLNSGLRIIKKELVEKFWGLLPNGFSFTTTITLALLVGGYRVKFTPIDYHHRTGSSKIRPIRDTLGFAALIVRTVIYFNPLRFFFPLSLLLILAGGGVLLASALWMERILDTTTALLVLTGVQIAVLGLLADVIAKQRS